MGVSGLLDIARHYPYINYDNIKYSFIIT